jgi:hypothetical protein
MESGVEAAGDAEIRSALKVYLSDAGVASGGLLIDELGLCQGCARVDLVLLDESLRGFEIKSERDVLTRLAGQIKIYNRVLDQVTIVAPGRHLPKIYNLVPDWWGILEVSQAPSGIQLATVRPAIMNPELDAYSISQLLWRAEVLEVLAGLGLDKGVLSKPRAVIWRRLVETHSLDEIRRIVRVRLRARGNWRN